MFRGNIVPTAREVAALSVSVPSDPFLRLGKETLLWTRSSALHILRGTRTAMRQTFRKFSADDPHPASTHRVTSGNAKEARGTVRKYAL